MSLPRLITRARVLVPALCLALALPSAAVADPGDPDPSGTPGTAATPGPLAGVRDLAEQALATVQELVEPNGANALTPPVGVEAAPERDATMALRDLALHQGDLSTSDRRAAARLLARPTDGVGTGCDGFACYDVPERAVPTCNTLVCVHSVATTVDAASLPYVQLVADTLGQVASTYRASGFRPPLADGLEGGDARFDVYLADLGTQGVYGYCAPEAAGFVHTASTAYCVLDNDYAAGQYGVANTPIGNLQVTAAHEFFHAVQFAYDYSEDGWVMEATATWAEDQLYDAIDDNRQYLPFGPLGRPNKGLDTWSGVYQYGAWIFFRFLSERYPAAPAPGALPSIVRRLWEYLAVGQYSVQALTSVLAEQGTTLPYIYAKFSAANRRPASYYSEGGAYEPAPLQARYRLTRSAPTRSSLITLDQLSSKTYRFSPGMTGRWKLRIAVNLNSTAAGGYAIVTVGIKGRGGQQQKIRLDRDGRGSVRVPFGSAVSWVELHAVNASARYTRCGSLGDNPFATCQGYAVDDGARARFEVKAYRA